MLLTKQKEDWVPHYYTTNDGVTCVCSSNNLCHVCSEAQKQPSEKFKENSDLLLQATKDSRDMETFLSQQLTKWTHHQYTNSNGNLCICTPSAICEACVTDVKNRMKDDNELHVKEVMDCVPRLDVYHYNNYPNIHIHNNILPAANINSSPSVDIHVNNNNKHQNIEIHNNILPQNYNHENQTVTKIKNNEGQYINLNDIPLNTQIFSSLSGIDPQSSKDMSKDQLILKDGNVHSGPSSQFVSNYMRSCQAGSGLYPDCQLSDVPASTSNTEFSKQQVRYSTSIGSINQHLANETQISNMQCHSTSTVTQQGAEKCSIFNSDKPSMPQASSPIEDSKIFNTLHKDQIVTSIDTIAKTPHENTLSTVDEVVNMHQSAASSKEKIVVKFPFKRKSTKEPLCQNDRASELELPRSNNGKCADLLIPNYPQTTSTYKWPLVGASSSSCTQTSQHTTSLDKHHIHGHANNMWTNTDTKLYCDKINLVNDTFLKNIGDAGWVIDADEDYTYILDQGKIRVVSTEKYRKETSNNNLNKVQDISQQAKQMIDNYMERASAVTQPDKAFIKENGNKNSSGTNPPRKRETKRASKDATEGSKISKKQQKKSKCCRKLPDKHDKVSKSVNVKSKISKSKPRNKASLDKKEPKRQYRKRAGVNQINQNGNKNRNKKVDSNADNIINNEGSTNSMAGELSPVSTQTVQYNPVSVASIPENKKRGNHKDIKKGKKKTIRSDKEIKTIDKPDLITKVGKKTAKTKVNSTNTQKLKIAKQRINKTGGTDKVAKKYATKDKSQKVASCTDEINAVNLSTLDIDPRVKLHCLLEDTRCLEAFSTTLEMSQDTSTVIANNGGSQNDNVKQCEPVIKRKKEDNNAGNKTNKKLKRNSNTNEKTKNGKISKYKQGTRGQNKSVRKKKIISHSRKLQKREVLKKDIGEQTYIDLTTTRRYTVVKSHVTSENKEVLANVCTVGENVETRMEP